MQVQADVDFHGSKGSLHGDNWGAHVHSSNIRADLHITTVLIAPFEFAMSFSYVITHRIDERQSHYITSQHVLRNKCLCIYLSGSGAYNKAGGFLLTPGVFGKIGSSFVLRWRFTPVCFHSVLCPCCKRERLTDWGGQMTVQVWVGANPSSGFPTQGRQWKEGKGCHSVSQRCKSQWQTSKTPELSSTDLRPCHALALLFTTLFKGCCYILLTCQAFCALRGYSPFICEHTENTMILWYVVLHDS